MGKVFLFKKVHSYNLMRGKNCTQALGIYLVRYYSTKVSIEFGYFQGGFMRAFWYLLIFMSFFFSFAKFMWPPISCKYGCRLY